MNVEEENRVVRLWKLLYGFSNDHLRHLFLFHFKKSFNASWADTTQNRKQLRKKISKPLFHQDHLNSQFDKKKCIKWDISLLCALLEHFLKNIKPKKKALASVRDVRNKFAHTSTMSISKEEADAMENKLKLALCALGAKATDFDQYASISLTASKLVELRLDQPAIDMCDDMLKQAQGVLGDNPRRAIDYCSQGLALCGLIPTALEARLYAMRARAREAAGEPKTALNDAQQAVMLGDAESRWLLATCYHASDRLSEACAEMERALPLQSAAKRTRGREMLSQWRNELDARDRDEPMNLAFTSTLSVGQRRALAAQAGNKVDNHSQLGRLPPGLLEHLPKPRACTSRGHEALRNDNFTDARRWFNQATELNDAEGMYNLAKMYADGCGGEQSFQAAVRLCERAIALPEQTGPFSGWRAGVGYANAMLGNFYRRGVLFDRDMDKAIYHWREAARLNAPAGFNMLGLVFLEGLNNANVDLAAARDLLQLGAQHGSNESRLNAGLLYLQQLNNHQRATLWFESARDYGLCSQRLVELLALAQNAGDQRGAPLSRDLPIRDELRASLSALGAVNRDCESKLGAYERNYIPSMQELSALPPSTMTELWCSAKKLAVDLSAYEWRNDTARNALSVFLQPDLGLVLTPKENEYICKAVAANFEANTMTHGVDCGLHPEHKAALFLLTVDTMKLADQITQLQAFIDKRTKSTTGTSVIVLHRLGQLLFFDGPTKDVRQGQRHLNQALLMLDSLDDSHPLAAAPLSVAYRMSLLYALANAVLIGDKMSFERRELELAQERLRRFVSLAQQHGSRKLPLAHTALCQIGLKLNNNDIICHHDAAVAADTALPAFIRGVAQRHQRFKSVAAMAGFVRAITGGASMPINYCPQVTPATFAGKCRAAAIGGELLGLAGVDTRLFTNTNTGLQHLRCSLAAFNAETTARAKRTSRPTVVRPASTTNGQASTFVSVTIDELVARGVDQVLGGRILRAMIVSEPVVKMTSAHFVIEDGERSVIRMVIYDHDPALLSQLRIGCVVDIVEPYYSFCSEGTQRIRVDHKQQPLGLGIQEPVCWTCLQKLPLKACSRCHRALYCSLACQTQAWKKHGHKLLCLRNKSSI